MWKRKLNQMWVSIVLPILLISIPYLYPAGSPQGTVQNPANSPAARDGAGDQAGPGGFDFPAALLPVDDTARNAWVQLLTTAMARNPEIRSQQQRIEQARGLQTQARLHPNPSLDLEAGTAADRAFSAAYSHVFETAGKRERRLAVADAVLLISGYELEETKHRIAGQLRSLFLQALVLNRELSTRRDLLRIATDLVSLVKRQVEVGEVRALTLDQAQVEAARVRSELELLRSQQNALLVQLGTLSGQEPTQSVEVRGELEPREAGFPVEQMSREALAARPDLKAAQTEIDRISARIDLLKAEAVPNIVGSATYSLDRSAFDLFGLTPAGQSAPIRELSHEVSVGVSFELPVRNRNEGNVAAAAAELSAQRLSVRSLEANIRREVSVAYERYLSSCRSLKVMQSDVLDRSKTALEALRKAYELGEISFSDVLTEQRRLNDLQGAYDTILQAYATAASDLAQAVAVPVP